MKNNISLVVNGREIDFDEVEDLPLKITYKVFDIEEVDRSAGAYSNVFKVPATPRNTLALKPLFDTQYISANNFAPALPCHIMNAAGVYLFKGVAGIKSVGKKTVPGYYELFLQGGNLDFALKLDAIPLNTLTLPTVTYPDAAQIENSWTNTYADKWVAPMACYGAAKWFAGLGAGELDWNGPVEFGPRDFRYWIFLRPLVEEMFRLAGYELQSGFITGAVFSRFIMYINDLNIYNNGNYTGAVNLAADLISGDRSCLDLLRGVAQFFNLKFDTDPVNGIVYCEQFDHFFPGAATDITGKVDYSRDIKFSGFDAAQPGVVFKLKEDTVAKGIREQWALGSNGTDVASFADWLTAGPPIANELYNKANSYYDGGAGIAGLDDRHVKENSFFMGYMMGAVPVYREPASGRPHHQLLMPLIWGDNDPESRAGIGWAYSPDSHGDRLLIPARQSGDTMSAENAPRIGYYAGMTEIQGLMVYGLHKTESPGLPVYVPYYDHVFRYSAGSSQAARPFVFLCDHFLENSTGNPLNFYYRSQAAGIRRRDPGFAFHEKREIPVAAETDLGNVADAISNGIIVECYLKLTDMDIRRMSLRGNYIFEHAACMLLEIIKYIPGGEVPTLCKFLMKSRRQGPATVINGGNHLAESCNYNQYYS
jgi:hypothetical protein